MKILVIDVAAEHGGALTVLNQFIYEFKSDKANSYVVVVGRLDYEDCDNIHFVKCIKLNIYDLFLYVMYALV